MLLIMILVTHCVMKWKKKPFKDDDDDILDFMENKSLVGMKKSAYSQLLNDDDDHHSRAN